MMTEESLNLEQLIAKFSVVDSDDHPDSFDIARSICQQGHRGIEYLFDQFDKTSHVEQKLAILFSLTLAWELDERSLVDYQRLRDLLLWALRSDDDSLIAAAMRDLLRIEDASVIDEIVQLLDHPSMWVHFNAWIYLVFLEPHIPKLSLEQLMLYFQKNRPTELAEECCEKIAALIRYQGQAGVDFLLNTFDQTPNIDKKCAILSVLVAQQYGPLIYGNIDELRLEQLLNSARASGNEILIMRSIDALDLLGRRDKVDQVMTFWSHPSPYVKGSILRYMSALFPANAFPMLIASASHAHFIVRENVADELSEMALTDEQKIIARPYVNILLNDEHPDVRAAAQWAFEAVNETDE